MEHGKLSLKLCPTCVYIHVCINARHQSQHLQLNFELNTEIVFKEILKVCF